MVSLLKIVENVEKKNKKLKVSKNKKKSWRKHINLKDVEIAIEEKEEEERLGVLGEKTHDLFFLDTGKIEDEDPYPSELKFSSAEAPKVTYTIDTNTGLKAPSKPKSDKLIHAHRYLAGLPGAKGPYKGVKRLRKQDSAEYKANVLTRSLGNARYAAKAELKKQKTFLSTKKSRKTVKQSKKLTFDNDLWNDDLKNKEKDDFMTDVVEYSDRTMGIKPINNRTSKTKICRLPGVVVPHPGLSYNPDLESHQNLLRKAVQKENSLISAADAQRLATTIHFPAGADASTVKHKTCDMDDDTRHVTSSKSKTFLNFTNETSGKTAAPRPVEGVSDEEEDPALPIVLKKERLTRQQRARKLRHKKQLHDAAVAKEKRKREKEVYRAHAFNREIDAIHERLARREMKRAQKSSKQPFQAVKHFISPDVEVPLQDELGGSVRTIKPTSNPFSDRMQHAYRRGLLPTHCKKFKREWRENYKKSQKKYIKQNNITPFTEEELLRDNDEPIKLKARRK